MLVVVYLNPGASYMDTCNYFESWGLIVYLCQGIQAQNSEGVVLTPANLKFVITKFGHTLPRKYHASSPLWHGPRTPQGSSSAN